jgi:pentatricopeptide repeat protein
VEAAADEGLASIVLNRCADLGRMDLCQEMMASLGETAVPLSGLTYCILIKGHGRAGNIRRVRQTYASMRELQVVIDPRLRPHLHHPRRLRPHHHHPRRLRPHLHHPRRLRPHLHHPHQVDIDLPTFNALTDAFVRNGRLGQAEAVLDQMAAVGIAPSTL